MQELTAPLDYPCDCWLVARPIRVRLITRFSVPWPYTYNDRAIDTHTNQFGALLLLDMITIISSGGICIFVGPRAFRMSQSNVPLALELRVERRTYGWVSVCTRFSLASDFRGPSGVQFAFDRREADLEDE
jgi:hypothetical protein